MTGRAPFMCTYGGAGTAQVRRGIEDTFREKPVKEHSVNIFSYVIKSKIRL